MSTADETERLLNEEEVAEMLGLKPQTLAAWRLRGRLHLPYVKVGGSIRYKPSDLREYIERQTKPAAEE